VIFNPARVYPQDDGLQCATLSSFKRRLNEETSYEQEVREGPSGKVYPLPRDKSTILHLAVAGIALVMLLLFGLLFVVIVGGTTGWISFAVACFALCCILAYLGQAQRQR